MASAYSPSVTASQIGSYFVQQYYQVLQQQPEFVHQFYADSSTMVRVDAESTETASAIFQIHTLIQSLHFSAIEIKTINSLESWSQGIVVVVSGSVKSKLFSGWRKFVQTFFLAPQDKGYFVMNDIFHFISEEVTHHRPSTVAPETKVDSQPISSTPSELLVGEDALEVEARENLNSIHLDENDEADYYNTSQETQHLQQQEDYVSEEYEEESPPEEPHSTVDYVQEPSYQNTVDEYVQEPAHQNRVEYVQEPVHKHRVEYVQEPVSAAEEPVAEPVKFTYASILRSKGKSPSVPAQPSVTKSVTPASEWDQIPEPVAPPTPVSYVPESTTQVPQESFTSEEDSKSVYVRNLPTTVTSHEIFEEFKNFGKIKQDGVFLKNRKDVGICFAFVEYEDLEGVQKAIEASPIHLAGRQVYIEERRANSSGGTRGGRGRGAGRGRGDAQRGGRYGGGSYARGNGYR
uniref:nuclear transport factor 2 isoform X2 n=1 Tax=Erigeron canadensis TaxID=72917 RepID=UPI001CB9A715|nr:nuclear transport factor 2 isoform X2 [Erigeron canadensis]